jgi:hypothetical protein
MLTRKQRSAEKRAAKVKELVDYFTQAYQAVKVQYPKEAVNVALERTESLLNRWSRKQPQERSFYVDVLIDFRELIKKAVA